MGINFKLAEISGIDISDKNKLELIMRKMDKKEIIDFSAYTIYFLKDGTIKINHKGGFKFRAMLCIILEKSGGDKELVNAYIKIELFWIIMLMITLIIFQLTLYYPISFIMILYNIIFFTIFVILPQFYFVFKYKKLLIHLKNWNG